MLVKANVYEPLTVKFKGAVVIKNPLNVSCNVAIEIAVIQISVITAITLSYNVACIVSAHFTNIIIVFIRMRHGDFTALYPLAAIVTLYSFGVAGGITRCLHSFVFGCIFVVAVTLKQ